MVGRATGRREAGINATAVSGVFVLVSLLSIFECDHTEFQASWLLDACKTVVLFPLDPASTGIAINGL